MYKNKKTYFLSVIISLVTIFIFSTKTVFARPVIHKVVDATKKDPHYETKYCDFKSNTNTASDVLLTVVRINTGGHAKTGRRFKTADSEGNALFCVTPEKRAIASTYNRGDRISENDAVGKYFYKTYQYYRDNMQYQSALAYTQAAFWYFYQVSDGGTNPSDISQDGLAEAIFTMTMSAECSKYENRIKQYIENDKFSCNDFLNGNDTKGKIPVYDPFTRTWKKSTSDETIGLSQYLDLFETNAIETRDITGNHQSLYDLYKTSAINMAKQIMNYSLYLGDLYYWIPNGYGQILIGIYGCPPGDVKKQCSQKLTELLKQYPNESQRTITNTTYYNKLVDILKGETNVSQEALNDPTFVANPKCSSKPEGSDCRTDLAILESYEGDPTKQTQYNELLEKMIINYPDEFRKNGKDYSCDSTKKIQTCEPEYEDNDCEFEHTDRTLYMNDSTNKACWNDRKIAYTTESGSAVSSVFEGVSKYCTVTCHELFQIDFPTGQTNIQAGQEFFWGFGDPAEAYFGNVNASKNCYTSYPNYNQFLADWNANEEKIKQAYAEYMAQVKYNEKSGYTKSNDTCCVSGEHAATSRTCNEDIWVLETYNYNPAGGCTGSGGSKPCDWNDHGQGLGWYYHPCTEGTPYSCDNPGYNYSRESETYTYPGTSITGTSTRYSECRASDPSDSDVDNSDAELSRLDTLNILIAGRSTLKSELEKCYSKSAINEDTIYHNVTNIKLTYTDPANTNRNIDGATLINKDNWSSFNSDGVVEQGGTITLNCSDTPGVNGGGTCGNVIQKYIEYYWDFVGLWRYYYNTEIFSWKFLLENGHAVNIKKFDESYSSFHNADGTVGFIASFKLITGFYEFAKVDVQGFGSDGHFNELFKENNDGNDTYEYSCPFQVVNNIYGSECRFDCDYNAKTCKITADSPAYCKTEVKGLDVVYRIIELTSAEEAAAGNINTVFPGIVGTGRKLGKNWNDFYTNNRTKYNNITTYNNVYDGGPIYTIDLTPVLIQEIRADNATYRNHKDGETNKPMDPYTSMKYTNGTKKYLCSDDTPTNQTCASEWLSSLSQRGLLTGEYGEIKDTKARLEAIRKAKDSTEASGTKNVTVVGGA